MKNAAQSELFSIRQEREFASLRDLSARMGSDPMLVQASNGNTSIKFDGILWIKASGNGWLMQSKSVEVVCGTVFSGCDSPRGAMPGF